MSKISLDTLFRKFPEPVEMTYILPNGAFRRVRIFLDIEPCFICECGSALTKFREGYDAHLCDSCFSEKETIDKELTALTDG